MPEQEKQCSKCKQLKSIQEFSRDNSKKSGLRSQCKTCYREYALSLRGKAAIHQANRRYFTTEKGKLTKRKSGHGHICSHKKATSRVWVEIHAGRLPRPTELKCEKCHDVPAAEYHHEDYDKPLEVMPLCQKCHIEIHGGVRI